MKFPTKKEIRAIVILSKVTEETIRIVVEEHPEIVAKAIINVFEKNPETLEEILTEIKERAEVQNSSD